jgi:hypothetical protein
MGSFLTSWATMSFWITLLYEVSYEPAGSVRTGNQMNNYRLLRKIPCPKEAVGIIISLFETDGFGLLCVIVQIWVEFYWKINNYLILNQSRLHGVTVQVLTFIPGCLIPRSLFEVSNRWPAVLGGWRRIGCFLFLLRRIQADLDASLKD